METRPVFMNVANSTRWMDGAGKGNVGLRFVHRWIGMREGEQGVEFMLGGNTKELENGFTGLSIREGNVTKGMETENGLRRGEKLGGGMKVDGRREEADIVGKDGTELLDNVTVGVYTGGGNVVLEAVQGSVGIVLSGDQLEKPSNEDSRNGSGQSGQGEGVDCGAGREEGEICATWASKEGVFATQISENIELEDHDQDSPTVGGRQHSLKHSVGTWKRRIRSSEGPVREVLEEICGSKRQLEDHMAVEVIGGVKKSRQVDAFILATPAASPDS